MRATFFTGLALKKSANNNSQNPWEIKMDAFLRKMKSSHGNSVHKAIPQNLKIELPISNTWNPLLVKCKYEWILKVGRRQRRGEKMSIFTWEGTVIVALDVIIGGSGLLPRSSTCRRAEVFGGNNSYPRLLQTEKSHYFTSSMFINQISDDISPSNDTFFVQAWENGKNSSLKPDKKGFLTINQHVHYQRFETFSSLSLNSWKISGSYGVKLKR